MSAFDDDSYEDLAYEEAEGAAEFEEGFEDEFEDDLATEAGDEFADEEALFGAEDEWEDAEESFEDDEFTAFEATDELDELDAFDDEVEAYDDYESDDMLDSVMAYAMDAEDTDEFFKKLWSGLRRVGSGIARVAKTAAPVIGGIARTAAPILSAIPHPYAQAAGIGASLLGTLRAEGATEEEALEAFAELAVRDKRAIPIVAGMTARTLVKNKGAGMSFKARKKAVKDAKAAAKALVRRRGRKAVRALPKIVKSVKRTAATKGTPPSARTKIVRRTAVKVARSPGMTRRLSRPSPKARRLVRRVAVRVRSYTLPGRTRITIAPA